MNIGRHSEIMHSSYLPYLLEANKLKTWALSVLKHGKCIIGIQVSSHLVDDETQIYHYMLRREKCLRRTDHIRNDDIHDRVRREGIF